LLAFGSVQPPGSSVMRAKVWLLGSKMKIRLTPVSAPVPPRSAVLSNASIPPSSLSAGLRLAPAPLVSRTTGAPRRSPSQICDTPVSAPVVGSLVDSKASRVFFALTTGFRLVPTPVLACHVTPSSPRTKT
jgi:hypothetical protein